MLLPKTLEDFTVVGLVCPTRNRISPFRNAMPFQGLSELADQLFPSMCNWGRCALHLAEPAVTRCWWTAIRQPTKGIQTKDQAPRDNLANFPALLMHIGKLLRASQRCSTRWTSLPCARCQNGRHELNGIANETVIDLPETQSQ